MEERVAIVGLGYVGLPIAIACARKFPITIGFDINKQRVRTLQQGIDYTGETSSGDLQQSTLKITSCREDLGEVNFFIVAVPTPIDKNYRPDLTALIHASEIIGQVLEQGSVIVYESTVYPGVTEEVCGPTLAKVSGLQQGIDFKLGYSPERINPGDRNHTLEKIVKVVAGEDKETLSRVAALYEAIVDVGVYRATSIKTAETAKVIENAQRDLNIAFMNELALICDRLGIRTHDVIEAAKTKWNFLPFTPGLVGGHCIGVDPYYLTTKAEILGYNPEVILAGRRINDSMGIYLAQRLVKLLVKANLPIQKARVGILGLTFKENVRDLRNSRIPDIVCELKQFGINALVDDPLGDVEEAQKEYGIKLSNWRSWSDLDAMILAVNHETYLNQPIMQLLSPLKYQGVLMDVKSALDSAKLPPEITYWSL